MNPHGEIEMSPPLRRICDLVAELVARVKRDLEKRPLDNLPKKITLYWFAKAAKTYEATLRLWTIGYWQDAAILGRTIWDIFFQVAYLATDPERLASKFWADPIPRWSKMLKDIAEHGVPDEETRTWFAEYLKRTNISEDEIRRVESWWVDESADENRVESKRPNRQLRSLAEAVGSERAYLSQYPVLSFLVHGSPPAMRYYVLVMPDRFAVDWTANSPPADVYNEAEMMLSAAPVVMADVIQAISAIWGLDYSDELAVFKEMVKEYNEQQS